MKTNEFDAVYTVVAQIGEPEDWSWEEVDETTDYEYAKHLHETEGCRVYIGDKQVL